MVKEAKRSFGSVLGNSRISEYLRRLLSGKEENLLGTYIFSGPTGVGKLTAAYFFAQALLCRERVNGVFPCGLCSFCRSFASEKENRPGELGLARRAAHSDLSVLEKEEDAREIKVEQTREFIRFLSLSSFLDSFKVGIIKEAEKLTIESANALLKMLEEPKGKAIIILIASDLAALPETIVSRAKILRFMPVGTEEIYDYLLAGRGAKRSEAKNFSRLAAGRPALANKFFSDKDFYNDYMKRASLFLSFAEQDLVERFASIDDILKEVKDDPAASASTVNIWQAVNRDMIFSLAASGDLIYHEPLAGEITVSAKKIGLPGLLSLYGVLARAKKYLSANVSPRSVFENIIINYN